MTRNRPHSSDTEHLRALLSDDYSDEDVTSYYAMTPDEALSHGDTKRFGRGVVWVGMEGALIEVDGRYARAIAGNVFERRKLASVVNAIETGQRPTLVVGYGDLHLITPTDVAEDQEAFDRGELLAERPLEKSDVGQFLYQIRDGNHRVFGALLAGETSAWIHLSKNRMQEIAEYRRAKRARKLAAFKAKYGARYAKEMSMIDAKLRDD